MEQLALSTPYSLRHSKKAPPTSAAMAGSDGGGGGGGMQVVTTIRTGRPGVELGMDLNMESIAEPLRKIAPGVFEEMDRLKQEQFTAAVTGLGDSELLSEGEKSTEDNLGSFETSNATREQKESKETGVQGRGRTSEDNGESGQGRSHHQPLEDHSRAETDGIRPAELDGKSPSSDTGSHRSTKSQESSDHSVTINSIAINSSGSQLLAGASPSLVGQLPAASLSVGTRTTVATTQNVLYHHTTPLAKDKAA